MSKSLEEVLVGLAKAGLTLQMLCQKEPVRAWAGMPAQGECWAAQVGQVPGAFAWAPGAGPVEAIEAAMAKLTQMATWGTVPGAPPAKAPQADDWGL